MQGKEIRLGSYGKARPLTSTQYVLCLAWFSSADMTSRLPSYL
jgi:hypothetical protein